jgi:hypothetical protein
MTIRYQMQLLIEADDSVELDRLKAALSHTVSKSAKLEVKAISGHQVKAPGAPDKLRQEIRDYLKGRRRRSVNQIARAINRTNKSLYRPLRELHEKGEVGKVYNNKYGMQQYFLVENEEDASPFVDDDGEPNF